jgi:hypothetical protein
MRVPKLTLCLILGLLAGAVGSWFLRAAYDRHFMLNGRIYVLNAIGQDAVVTLKFPSGVVRTLALKQGASREFVLHDTGEGSVAVLIDEELRDHVGYVTAMNPMILLVVGEKTTQYSQINPALPLPGAE